MKLKLISILLLLTYTNALLLPKGWFDIKTVDELEIQKYLGKWYEMYNSLIQRLTFEKDLLCTTAFYKLKADGKSVDVTNSGRLKSPTGEASIIFGNATRPNPDKYPGELIVSFPGSPKSNNANYLVVKLGPVNKDGKYDYTIITSPFKAFSWILARDPKIYREKYEVETLKYLKDNGYFLPWNRPRKTYQEDDCLYTTNIKKVSPEVTA